MAPKDNTPNKLLDHNYDGIQEFDNSLPKWWLYGFYFTMVFSVAYMAYYHFAGGPSSAQEYDQQVSAAAEQAEKIAANQPPPAALALLTDAASLAAGKQMFEGEQACASCHKADGGGLVGPNLTDNLWIHGCSFDDVVKSIQTGFADKGMPAYGNGTKISDEKVAQLASYVMSLKGTNPPDAKAADAAREVPCGQ